MAPLLTVHRRAHLFAIDRTGEARPLTALQCDRMMRGTLLPAFAAKYQRDEASFLVAIVEGLTAERADRSETEAADEGLDIVYGCWVARIARTGTREVESAAAEGTWIPEAVAQALDGGRARAATTNRGGLARFLARRRVDGLPPLFAAARQMGLRITQLAERRQGLGGLEASQLEYWHLAAGRAQIGLTATAEDPWSGATLPDDDGPRTAGPPVPSAWFFTQGGASLSPAAEAAMLRRYGHTAAEASTLFLLMGQSERVRADAVVSPTDPAPCPIPATTDDRAAPQGRPIVAPTSKAGRVTHRRARSRG